MVLPAVLKGRGLYNVQNRRNLLPHVTGTGYPSQKDERYAFWLVV